MFIFIFYCMLVYNKLAHFIGVISWFCESIYIGKTMEQLISYHTSKVGMMELNAYLQLGTFTESFSCQAWAKLRPHNCFVGVLSPTFTLDENIAFFNRKIDEILFQPGHNFIVYASSFVCCSDWLGGLLDMPCTLLSHLIWLYKSKV